MLDTRKINNLFLVTQGELSPACIFIKFTIRIHQSADMRIVSLHHVKLIKYMVDIAMPRSGNVEAYLVTLKHVNDRPMSEF